MRNRRYATGSRTARGLIAGTVMLALLSALGCRGTDPRVFDPRQPIGSRILPLQLHVMSPWVPVGAKPPDFRPVLVKDARYLVIKDLRRKVFEAHTPVYGHGVVRIRWEPRANVAWVLPSVLSLTALNLLGVPLLSMSMKATVDFDILDSHLESIAHFEAVGSDTEYSAIYWGRSAGASWQMLFGASLENALKHLKTQLDRDANGINQKLRAAGPLPGACGGSGPTCTAQLR